MKKLFFSLAVGILASFSAQSQILKIDNQTPCSVYVDFHCRDAACGAQQAVTPTSPLVPGNTIVTHDAAILYPAQNGGAAIPAGYSWEYGLVGQAGFCSPQAPGGGCTGTHIQMSKGNCALPLLTSGCVNVDATCNGGCPVLNVSAVFHPNGDCDLTIN
ncbi:MAG: hypothetical protein R2800_01695 [Flavipsychrobacter sp.]